jgi:hypothetical protein
MVDGNWIAWVMAMLLQVSIHRPFRAAWQSAKAARHCLTLLIFLWDSCVFNAEAADRCVYSFAAFDMN